MLDHIIRQIHRLRSPYPWAFDVTPTYLGNAFQAYYQARHITVYHTIIEHRGFPYYETLPLDVHLTLAPRLARHHVITRSNRELYLAWPGGLLIFNGHTIDTTYHCFSIRGSELNEILPHIEHVFVRHIEHLERRRNPPAPEPAPEVLKPEPEPEPYRPSLWERI